MRINPFIIVILFLVLSPFATGTTLSNISIDQPVYIQAENVAAEIPPA